MEMWVREQHQSTDLNYMIKLTVSIFQYSLHKQEKLVDCGKTNTQTLNIPISQISGNAINTFTVNLKSSTGNQNMGVG